MMLNPRPLIGAATLIVLSSAAPAQINFKQRVVLTGNEAYALLPSQIVAAPVVRQVHWSHDGRFLLCVREAEQLSLPLVRALLQRGDAR